MISERGIHMEFELRNFETKNRAVTGGSEIEYRTVCGDYPVKASDGTVLGTMFTYSYIRTDVSDTESRPVLFAFNGGPGSSAMWLHAGILAPRTVKLENATSPQTVPPFELEDNEECLLDICDIVLIDPMGTGYSVILNEERQKEVYSIEQDAQIFAEYIWYWQNREKRWNSPKYVMGESYGTLRACLIPTFLMGGPFSVSAAATGLTLDGIILMGSAVTINPGIIPVRESLVEPMVLDFPTMAACNWYHTKGEKPELKSFIEEAFTFAEGELLSGLYKGNSLTEEERRSFFEKLSYFTGLPESLLVRKHGRIDTATFSRERLGHEGLDIGLYDGRYVLPQSNRIGTPDPVADDGAMGLYTPAFRGAFEQLVRELGIKTEQSYKIINFSVNGMWSYDSARTPAEHLQAAIRRNKSLRILICSGCYDLVTTMGQARYAANHFDRAEDQIIVKEYESGHMPYLGKDSRKALAEDCRNLILKKPVTK